MEFSTGNKNPSYQKEITQTNKASNQGEKARKNVEMKMKKRVVFVSGELRSRAILLGEIFISYGKIH
jgi:hypothetical protein